MRMKIIIFLFFSLPIIVFGQSLRLDTCQKKAKNNYPLLKQYGLIEKTADYNLSNANKAYLPQVSLLAKATYQSDVTAIPENLGQVLTQLSGQPVSFPVLSKDQYQAALEVNQLVWDGGVVNAQKKMIKASSEAEKQKLEVDLYALNDRINNLFFGVMLIKEQLNVNRILQDELASNYQRMQSYLKNGLIQQADLDAVKVEQINAAQQETDLKSVLKSYCQMLSVFTGLQVNENTELEKPLLPIVNENIQNKRPELSLFDSQKNLLESQKKTIVAGNLPKIGLFIQGGYGRPGFDFFNNDFTSFYIGGVRLSWNISGFYTQKNELKKIETGQKNVDIMKETFLFNTNLLTTQQLNEIDKLRSTLKNDEEIILLRNNIKKAAEAKFQNGTITATDLLREINAENIARQTRTLHEIQLYMAVYQLKNTTNN
ncbi:MAG TPA: TolC family protein [Paludibacteraceae bacterium]|nr:TolC family protein [Paludibacteraceae bacterium]HPO67923.1 TolC family protein [Paludibacteraceae bacterium]